MGVEFLMNGAIVMAVIFFGIRAMIPRDLQAGPLLRGIFLVLGVVSVIAALNPTPYS